MIIDPVAVPSLANAIAQVTEGGGSDTEMRIGKVVSYDSGSITVSISGSGVLINAAYAFGQYQPALGDNVVLMRMGNQWIALCSQSGNPSDNEVLNYSFEDGLTGVVPDQWTLPASNWRDHERSGSASTPHHPVPPSITFPPRLSPSRRDSDGLPRVG
jgi:hypothetical protein